MVLKFYFFTFLAYFKNKDLDSTPWFRAISLVSLSYINVICNSWATANFEPTVKINLTI